jgi:methyl-accepting chemotaxis protein
MSKQKNVLNELRVIQENLKTNGKDYTSHMVVAIDTDENGFPESTITMSNAKPLETIAMCEHLISVLQEIKTRILATLSPYNDDHSEKSKVVDPELSNFEKMTNDLPKPIADKIRSFKKRMDEAVESGDLDEMSKLKQELMDMKNPFKKMKSELEDMKKITEDEDEDTENDNFNINDFI